MAQHRLLTERYGIQRLELALAWSMGAEQTYGWAVRFRDMVKRALPFAGTAKTTPHDFIFARSHEDALKSDPAWDSMSAYGSTRRSGRWASARFL